MPGFNKIALLAACAALPLISACGETKVIAKALPTPPERLVCERAGTRPVIPAEPQIDWSQITSVEAARRAHLDFVAVVRTREGIVAGYVLKLEDVNFVCWNNVQWRREFEAGLAQPGR